MDIATFYNLPDGGAKRVLHSQLKYLSTKHSIDLFLIDKKEPDFLNVRSFAKDITYYDFKINSDDRSVMGRLNRDYRSTCLLSNVHQKIAHDIDNSDHDIVLVHSDIYTESPFLLRYLNTPSLYYSHELLRVGYEEVLQLESSVVLYKRMYEKLIRKIRKDIDKKNAQSSTKIVTNSKFMKKNIKKAYQIEANICYPGVETEVFKKSGKTLNGIIFMGSKVRVDGYPLLRSVNNILQRKEVEILDFSDGKAKINDDNKLSEVYSQGIVTLCLDHAEPFGLKAIESMACETPVLAVDEGGYKETVVDGVTGFLLPRDPQAFADKIKWLQDNPDEAKKMGKAGREHIKKNFTWEKHNKCIEKLLIETANAKK